ncbi:MAG: hypothetical protein HQM13_08430 [SAR324 cluster bacterium]|nr:hypothetical protein [SAR324 cluster bacterium]
MTADFEVTCAIPRSGRTLTNFLNKLKFLGTDAGEIDAVLKVIARSKQTSSTDLQSVISTLNEIEKCPSCFSVFVDRKRSNRPYRIGFLGYNWKIQGISVRVEGEEPHNGSSLIKLDEVDFTVVGLDELLSMTQYYLSDPSTVTKWGMYNYHLEKPTGIRVAGSAQLTRYNPVLKREVQDIVGFFLISGSGRKHSMNLETLSRSGQRVFVKGRYTGIVAAAYPNLKLISVEDVEDAVVSAEKGSAGIEIVQSGNTIKQKKLLLHGAPLFLSESLYVVDYDRFLHNKTLQKLIKALKPVGYFEDSRIREFALWYYALERNLGESWIDKPPISQFLCEPTDVENGLRPYRLQTRRWKPDDHYKKEGALKTIQKAQQNLQKYYLKYVDQYGK